MITREEYNARKRERYASDPEYRTKRRAECARYLEQKGEKIRAGLRERMSDPAFRDAVNKRQVAWRKKHRVQINKRNRDRYATDPVYRQMRMESAAKAKQKRRAKLLSA